MSFAGEVWAVTVDGKTYSYVSSGSETVLSIVTTLKGAITGAYTVSVAGSANDATLTIVATAEDVLDAFGSVVLDTQETQGTATATASGSSVTITLPSASVVGVGETWTLTVDGKNYAYTVHTRRRDRADRLRPRHRRHARRALHRRRDLVVDHAQPGRRNDRRGLARGLDARRGSAATRAARASRSTSRASRRRARSGRLTVGTTTYSFAVLYGDTLSDIAAGLGADLCRSRRTTSPSSAACSRSRASTTRRSPSASRSLQDSQRRRGRSRSSSSSPALDGTWNQAQTVNVEAIDNNFVDGHDALVFPPMTGRTDQIRGPVIIDGGLGVNPEPFLNAPAHAAGRDEPAARRRHDHLPTGTTNASAPSTATRTSPT